MKSDDFKVFLHSFELFGGGNRDRTADLLNAIQALSQLSYTPTGKVYHIRKRHECQERFCISAKKSARRFGRRAEGFFRIVCAPARSRLAVAADDVRDGGGQLLVPVGVEMLAVERAHLRDRAGVQKPQAIRLGDHLILRRHALRDGERLRVILRVALRRGRAERRRGHEQDLRAVIRGGGSDEELKAVILEALAEKPDGHAFGGGLEKQKDDKTEKLCMAQIGG